jgi:hypothetical protein
MKREFLPPWSPAGDAADWAWPLAAGVKVYGEMGVVLPADEEPVPAPPVAWAR